VTWNGTTVTGPVLIYHDEVLFSGVQWQPSFGNPDSNGSLVCIANQEAYWYIASTTRVEVPRQHYDVVSCCLVRQIHKQNTQKKFSQLSFNREGGLKSDASMIRDTRSITNGLWNCRNDNDTATQVSIGLYARGGGK